MLHKPLYIAAYHQSRFGKLKTMQVPEIVANAVTGACGEIGVEPAMMDVGSIGSACGFTLNDQGLLSGLMAMVPGLEGKPIEHLTVPAWYIHKVSSNGASLLLATNR